MQLRRSIFIVSTFIDLSAKRVHDQVLQKLIEAFYSALSTFHPLSTSSNVINDKRKQSATTLLSSDGLFNSKEYCDDSVNCCNSALREVHALASLASERVLRSIRNCNHPRISQVPRNETMKLSVYFLVFVIVNLSHHDLSGKQYFHFYSPSNGFIITLDYRDLRCTSIGINRGVETSYELISVVETINRNTIIRSINRGMSRLDGLNHSSLTFQGIEVGRLLSIDECTALELQLSHCNQVDDFVRWI